MLGAKRPQIIAGLIKLGGQVSNDIVRDLQGYCLPLSTLHPFSPLNKPLAVNFTEICRPI